MAWNVTQTHGFLFCLKGLIVLSEKVMLLFYEDVVISIQIFLDVRERTGTASGAL